MTDVREQAAIDELKRWNFGEYPYDLNDLVLRCLKAADAVTTKVHVIRKAHEVGLHKGVMSNGCELCFKEAYDDYATVCQNMMLEIGRPDGAVVIKKLLQDMASYIEMSGVEGEPHRYPTLMFHEHPVYEVCRVLGIDLDSPECDDIATKTRHIWDTI